MASEIKKIKKFKFSIDGTEYKNVTGFQLCLFPSTAPNVEVFMHSSAEQLEIFDLKDSYDLISELKDKLYSDRVNLELEVSSDTGETETLKLKDWVFTNIHDFNPTSASIILTIHHPVYKLSVFGGFLNINSSTLDLFESSDVTSVGDIIDAWQTALTRISDAPNDESEIPPNVTTAEEGKTWQEIKEEVSDVVKKYLDRNPITSFLEWKPDVIKNGNRYSDKIPLESAVPEISTGIKRAMLDGPLSLNNVDIWSTFISECSSLSISVIPEYWEKVLPVAPVTYWAEPSISIDSDSIFNLVTSIIDPDPVFGVRLIDGSLDSGALSSFVAGGQQGAEDSEFQLAYVPKESKISLTGRFITFSSPVWWDSALQYAASDVGISSYNSINDDPSVDTSASINPSIEEAETGMIRIAEDLFYSQYRARTSASIMTKFMIKSKGEYIVPGKVVTVTHNGSGFITGYCNQVIICVDIANNNAYTTVGLSHVRLADNKDGTCVIKDDTLNPLYK